MLAKKKKKTSTKKKKTSTRTKSLLTKTDRNAIDKLVKNNVELQKVSLLMVESSKILTDKIGKLIDLFEEAAKNIGDVDEFKIREETGSLSGRLDSLLEQNRDLAKGLLLLEKYVRGRNTEPIRRGFVPRPLPMQ